jgi:uncharacterized membrane protein YccC
MAEPLSRIPDALWQEVEALARGGESQGDALKAVLSVLLAVAAAMMLHLPDIVWAALSGFIVMKSRLAEALPRGLNRILGTLAGAVLGFIAARWVAPSPVLLMAALFLFTWVGIFQATVSGFSYGWTLFGVTASLVLTQGLADADSTAAFAATRVAEVTIGTAAALLVSFAFELSGAPPGQGAPQAAPVAGATLSLRRLCDEAWLAAHWRLITHAARAAIAVAMLPLIWRAFDITNYAQTAVTSYIVMIVPAGVIERGESEVIYTRMLHRGLGCLLGALLALLCLRIAADDRLLWALCLSLGVWIGFSLQSGKTGIAYVGTQFAFAFLFTFVQGPGPATSVTPGLERLLGIAIGAVTMTVVLLIWPPAAGPQPAMTADRPRVRDAP